MSVSEGRKCIDDMHDAWLKFFHKGDGHGIATLYTDDMISLPPNTEIITTKEGIVDYFNAMFAQAGGHGLETSFTIDKLEVHGEYMYFVGKYRLYGKAEGSEEQKMTQDCKHLVIYKKVNDKWLYHRDLWNGNGQQAFQEASKGSASTDSYKQYLG